MLRFACGLWLLSSLPAFAAGETRTPEEVRADLTYGRALVTGTVEGITEYLPVSSTGHMIITSSLMGIHTDEFTKLYEVAIQLGAILAASSEAIENACADYGQALGTAFQVIDDVLDYAGESTALGKNVGDDLREGKPTLPLIHAMLHDSPRVQAKIRDAIANGGTQDVSAIMASIEQTGSLNYTRAKAVDLARSISVEV